MRAGSHARSRLWLGGVAIAGVVFAHVLAYFIAAPHRNGSEMLLGASGHRHWAVVAAIAFGALVAGLIWFTTQPTRPDRVWSLGARAFFVSTARRLILLQVSGFVLLEASERLLFGAGLGQVLAEPVVLIGILLQVVSALGAAGLLVVFARTLDRLCDRSSAARFVASPGPRPRVCVLPPRFLLAAGGATLRGPPFRRSSFASIPSS